MKPNWQEAIAGYPRLVTSFDLRPRSTALVITDIQNRAISSQFGLGAIFRVRYPEVHEYFTKRLNEIVIPNNMRLLNFFRERGLRVIFLTVGPELPDGSDWVSPIKLGFSSYQRSTGIRGLYPRGTPEHRVIAPLAPRPDELVINKTTSGAFNSTGFEVTLRTLGIDTMLITGLSTCACVETTARAASDRGIKCAIIEDCCAAFDQELHNATMRSVYLYYGDVRNTDEVIGQLASRLQVPASRLGTAIPGGAE